MRQDRVTTRSSRRSVALIATPKARAKQSATKIQANLSSRTIAQKRVPASYNTIHPHNAPTKPSQQANRAVQLNPAIKTTSSNFTETKHQRSFVRPPRSAKYANNQATRFVVVYGSLTCSMLILEQWLARSFPGIPVQSDRAFRLSAGD